MATESGAEATERQARIAWIRATMDRYERPLLGYTQKITGDLETARDVVQDAFFRLLEQSDWQALRPAVKAWLYRVCRNRALDLKRKDRPMRNATSEELDAREGPASDPATMVEEAQSGQLLRQLVAKLPEKQREVVRLKFEQDLSYAEIAEVTGHSVGNVGYLLHHGIAALRHRLTKVPALGLAIAGEGRTR